MEANERIFYLTIFSICFFGFFGFYYCFYPEIIQFFEYTIFGYTREIIAKINPYLKAHGWRFGKFNVMALYILFIYLIAIFCKLVRLIMSFIYIGAENTANGEEDREEEFEQPHWGDKFAEALYIKDNFLLNKICKILRHVIHFILPML